MKGPEFTDYFMGVDWAEFSHSAPRPPVFKANPHNGFNNAIDINRLVQIQPPSYARENRECAQ